MADLGPELREALEWLDGLSDTDPDKHEMIAYIYMTLARSHWRMADRYRQIQRETERRTERRRSRCER
jgi:hypothetical protein